MSDDLGGTFGEASAEAKDGVSHRGRSLDLFSLVLGEVFGGMK
jgi:inosine/xanthosine triphosphate pyrophosphatase family protein